MMIARGGLLAAALMLGGCASADGSGLDRQRTVFSNPYVPPVIDRSGIGPECERAQRPDAVCTGGPLIYPGRGRHALLGDGRIVRLPRTERRFLRERADALEAQRDARESLKNGTPLPPGSPALPSGLNAEPAPSRTPEFKTP